MIIRGTHLIFINSKDSLAIIFDKDKDLHSAFTGGVVAKIIFALVREVIRPEYVADEKPGETIYSL